MPSTLALLRFVIPVSFVNNGAVYRCALLRLRPGKEVYLIFDISWHDGSWFTNLTPLTLVGFHIRITKDVRAEWLSSHA